METIFFDLDGTLTDPKPGITRSIQYALTRLDLPVPSQDRLTWCIGPPLRESFVRMVGEELADRHMHLVGGAGGHLRHQADLPLGAADGEDDAEG